MTTIHSRVGSLRKFTRNLRVDARWPPVLAKGPLEVVREKDRTTYKIISDNRSRLEEKRDKKQAWQIMQGGAWINGRRRRPVLVFNSASKQGNTVQTGTAN
jgi:hypothetical protein